MGCSGAGTRETWLITRCLTSAWREVAWKNCNSCFGTPGFFPWLSFRLVVQRVLRISTGCSPGNHFDWPLDRWHVIAQTGRCCEQQRICLGHYSSLNSKKTGLRQLWQSFGRAFSFVLWFFFSILTTFFFMYRRTAWMHPFFFSIGPHDASFVPLNPRKVLISIGFKKCSFNTFA